MQKLYYSISEVSNMIDEEQHILRYWEKEFVQLNPKKNRAGNRIYSDKDITVLRIIKELLREEKLSLKGAKDNLKRINISILEENLFSGKNESGNASILDLNKPKDLPEDVLWMKKEDVEQIYTFYKEMKHFLLNIE